MSTKNISHKSMSPLFSLLTIVSILGNIIFCIWILYNGINEGFEGTRVEKFSYIALMGLLAVNALLLIRSRKFNSIG